MMMNFWGFRGSRFCAKQFKMQIEPGYCGCGPKQGLSSNLQNLNWEGTGS